MPSLARGLIFISFLAPAGPAAAQLPYSLMIAPHGAGVPAEERRPAGPDFRMWRGDPRQVGAPERSGLVAALPVGERLVFGVGRFGVIELPRPRTHMEHEPRPTDVRRRERGIAAVGVSFSF